MKRGFTLIELLVVVAIIAILAAILFPVFSRARESGRDAVCHTRQKQIVVAMLMYAKDNDGYLPGHNVFTKDFVAPDGSITGGCIYPYLTAPQEILQCPSDVHNRRWQNKNEGGQEVYIYSFTVNSWTNSDGQGDIPGSRGNGQFANGAGHRLDHFPNHAAVIVVVDENTDYAKYNIVVNDAIFTNIDRASDRHGGRPNVCYLDGHTGDVPAWAEWDTAKWPNGEWMFTPGRRGW